ncbi:DNA repair protein RecO [Chromohalobacter sp. HP20-39]|uniref:DNA repair protein RecO n=1 Tax=Chromohalobacter sp. HP20-39 TaxID=3079306 RepID=UPI00294AFF96|nr:DNA repair protein RecO [Chromohalobacter sp. HP20-39]MDV6319985.1 DNA repair protein RecO [Chromohalobacter sp. HP20-39]
MTPEPAFLLHKRAYRETSAIVELLTLTQGRVRAVAQGVQRGGSKARGILQPYSPLHVTWSGNGELKRLRLLESQGSTALLAGEGLLCGFYANELMARVLPLEYPVGEVFSLYALTLEALPSPAKRAGALRRLEITLLESLDMAPRFVDEHDAPLDAFTHYRYHAERHCFRAVAPGQSGIDGRSLKWLARGDWEAPGLAGVAKHVTRAALAPLLGDRPLRSRELMQRLAERRRTS